MEKMTDKEEKTLDALLAHFRQGYKPFPETMKGIGDCHKITFYGGIAICEEVMDRDDGDMNEYWRHSTALVTADSIYNQGLAAIRNKRMVMTYESINSSQSKDRRDESPGSPTETAYHNEPGHVAVTMDLTTFPPVLMIELRPLKSAVELPANPQAPTSAQTDPKDARSQEYVQRHGYEMNG